MIQTNLPRAILLATLLAASAASGADDPRAGLRLLAPRALGAERGILASAQALEEGVTTLAIAIDGSEIAVGPAPRLDAPVPLDWPPRPQILEAEARDAHGCPVELELAFLRYSARSFPVALRVTGVGCDEQGPWARVFAHPPVGAIVARVQLFAGDSLVGAANQLPAAFRLTGRDLAEPFLRAEVELVGGGGAEATHLFGGDRFGEVVDVRRGEARRTLPERRGRRDPIEMKDVRATWRGAPQPVVRVESGAEVPLELAVAVDASPSTSAFRDRVFGLAGETTRALASSAIQEESPNPPLLVLFSDTALVTLASSDPERLTRLADSLPFGVTAMFDALAVSLHEMAAAGRRAALLAVTDGCDTGSASSAAGVSALAQALGIPIYALVFDESPCFERVATEEEAERRRREAARRAGKGLAVDPASARARVGSIVQSPGWGRTRDELRELCRASGGELFRIAGKDDLSKVWKRILADLERQVVIVYEPSGPEVDPAEVAIEIAPPKRRGLLRR